MGVDSRCESVAELPEEEEKAWQRWWADVNQLQKAVAAQVQTVPFQGKLTAQERQRVHEVQFKAGQVYLIDMESAQFDTFLRLYNAKGELLAENDDIVNGVNLNSRLIFTAAADGTYRLLAFSYDLRGIGTYTLTVRLLREDEEVNATVSLSQPSAAQFGGESPMPDKLPLGEQNLPTLQAGSNQTVDDLPAASRIRRRPPPRRFAGVRSAVTSWARN